jgi:hypothetical protein
MTGEMMAGPTAAKRAEKKAGQKASRMAEWKEVTTAVKMVGLME